MTSFLARLDAYEKLVRLDKPIGILLLLWPTLWALWLAAGGLPPLPILVIFLMGTVLMRSAGCAINDWADRRFDAQVERTRMRPLATGVIRPWEALVVAAVFAALALAVAWRLNTLARELSVAAFAIAVIYPFTKRWFSMPQAFLGIAFSAGIPMAFAAVRNEVPPLAWALLAANFFWVIAYDTEYAMVDREDDRRIGIRTSAILLGANDVAAVMGCYVAFLAILAGIGYWQHYGWAYYAGIEVAGVLAVWHSRMIRDRSREGCFRAFLHNSWVGAAIFAGILLDQLGVGS
jgi:4-hydroxybenzoate polyprenyltransferase